MEIYCEFRFQNWYQEPRVYSCVVKAAKIVKPYTKIQKFCGTHEPGKTDNDVEGIKFSDSVIENFPKGLHTIFPKLSFVQICRCGLKTISQADLIGLENLKNLDLQGNKLKSLPNHLFENMSKLHFISFADNKLEFVSSKIFAPILTNQFDFVDFRENPNFDGVCLPGWNKTAAEAIPELMALIDAKCSEPMGHQSDDTFRDDFVKGFQNLYLNGRYTDFTLIVGRKDFQVHKCVLGMQSSVFDAIFKNDMQESKTSEMRIQEFTEAAVEQFLHFLYTGWIQDETNAMELFAIAAKYDVQNLKSICETIVLDNLDQANAHEVFSLGHLYDSRGMKEFSFGVIRRMFPDFKLDDKLIDTPEKLIEVIEALRKVQEAIGKISLE